MSDVNNTVLLESAAELIDYFEGTIMAKLLEADIDRNDFESLHNHVKEARGLQFQNEYNPAEVS